MEREKKELMCSQMIFTNHLWGRAAGLDMSAAGMYWAILDLMQSSGAGRPQVQQALGQGWGRGRGHG